MAAFLKRVPRSFTLVLAVSTLTLCADANAAIRHVKAGLTTGNHDGTSWTNAFQFLQDALAVAQAGDEIWVARGEYFPDESTSTPGGTGDPNATFNLVAGVSVYGHFAGGESLLSQRPAVPLPGSVGPDPNETILNGDLGDND